MKRERICLIQPANPYQKEIYFPGSIANLCGRLIRVGYSVEILDLNLASLDDARTREIVARSDYIGVTVLGTPIIPEACTLVLELRRMGYARPILLGGEGLNRLSHEEVARMFPRDIYGDLRHVVTDEDLRSALNTLKRIPRSFEVSMRPAVEGLSSELFVEYFSREFCLFVSQGCAYRCDFCAAAKGQREEYRDSHKIEDEVDYIAQRMAEHGLRTMNVYLSNLDGFQTPDKLEEALRTAHAGAAKHGIEFRARMLATTKMTKRAIERDLNLLRRLQGYGLCAIGFGVDGVSSVVWERLRKRHNSLAEYETCRAACTAVGIRTEMLMVVGFRAETWNDGLAAILYSMQNAYGPDRVIVRPYLAKEHVPGSKGWQTDEAARERLLANPSQFGHQGYSMFLTEGTAPDWEHRMRGNLTFLAFLVAMAPAGLSTYPMIPLPPGSGVVSRIARAGARWFNALMPPDR